MTLALTKELVIMVGQRALLARNTNEGEEAREFGRFANAPEHGGIRLSVIADNIDHRPKRADRLKSRKLAQARVDTTINAIL